MFPCVSERGCKKGFNETRSCLHGKKGSEVSSSNLKEACRVLVRVTRDNAKAGLKSASESAHDNVGVGVKEACKALVRAARDNVGAGLKEACRALGKN